MTYSSDTGTNSTTKAPTTPACDFCATPAAVTYPARPTTTRGVVTDAPTGRRMSMVLAFGSADWLACETCRALIASGRRDDLARRALDVFMARHPNMAAGLSGGQARRQRRELRAAVRGLQDDFWSARLGPPIPFAMEAAA